MSSIESMTPADRARLMPGLKALLAGGLKKRFTRKRKGKEWVPRLEELRARVQQMITEHERKYGRVRPYPVPKTGM